MNVEKGEMSYLVPVNIFFPISLWNIVIEERHVPRLNVPRCPRGDRYERYCIICTLLTYINTFRESRSFKSFFKVFYISNTDSVARSYQNVV